MEQRTYYYCFDWKFGPREIHYPIYLPATSFTDFIEKAHHLLRGTHRNRDDMYLFERHFLRVEAYEKVADHPLPALNYRIVARWVNLTPDDGHPDWDYQEVTESRVTKDTFVLCEDNGQKVGIEL